MSNENEVLKTKRRLRLEELAVDEIAVKAKISHPDHPVTEGEIDLLLSEIDRLSAENAELERIAYGERVGD